MALTRVIVSKKVEVLTDIYFSCPREIAELYKTMEEDINCFVDIEEVKKVWNFHREYGIKEPGTYMVWDEEDGTKKSYKLENYSSIDVDTAEFVEDIIVGRH
tara:strand:+ start:1640 stop:1945 length:306 start_codon:yes stop_codon:yes gene_type:complete